MRCWILLGALLVSLPGCGRKDCDPGATEVRNNVDDNCDGQVDEDFDSDGDGYTTCAVPVLPPTMSPSTRAAARPTPGRPSRSRQPPKRYSVGQTLGIASPRGSFDVSTKTALWAVASSCAAMACSGFSQRWRGRCAILLRCSFAAPRQLLCNRRELRLELRKHASGT